MIKILKSQDFVFIFSLSFIGSFLASFLFGLLSINFSKVLYQYNFLESSQFNYIYTTGTNSNQNSFLIVNNTKIFFSDEGMNSRLNVSSIMQLNVVYNQYSLLGNNLNIDGLNFNEIIITKHTSVTYQLYKDSKIYSVNIGNLTLNEYIVKGIINDVYPLTKDFDNNSTGLLFFGYSSIEEDSIQNKKYINTSFDDPSSFLIENNINLIDIQNKENLTRISFFSLISFLIFKFLILTLIFGFIYYHLITDVKDHFIRLRNQGSLQGFLSMLNQRLLIFISSSLFIFSIFFSIIYGLFSLPYNLNIVLITLIITSTTILVNRFIPFVKQIHE